MALDPVDLLLNALVDDGRWPPRRESLVHEEVRTYRAFLTSDRDALRQIAGWVGERDYKVDPLAELIADTWGDHLFGEDVDVTPASTADDKAMTALLDGLDDLTDDLRDAERVVVGEGEAWWRCYVDRDLADVPLLDWHSRDAVFPFRIGDRVLACALVSELPKRARDTAVYRHFEIHAAGVVEHVLFRGTKAKIGATVPLERHPDLAELAAGLPGTGLDARRWNHGLPMLMGRVGNGRRVDRTLHIGISDYKRIADFLLDLNEAATIGAENMRLTAKRRAIVPEEALREQSPELVDRGDGTFDTAPARPRRAAFNAGEELLVVSALDAELGGQRTPPFTVLEYSFDADALIAYKRDLVETTLTRVGLTPSYVGAATGEPVGVLSGTAYRLKLIPTTKAGRGKARSWLAELPAIVGRLAMLDALAVADGGFGRTWSDATTPPGVALDTPIPSDPVEDATVEAALVGAGVRSRETSVRAQHPDWSDAQVAEELDRIAKDRPATSGLLGAGGLA